LLKEELQLKLQTEFPTIFQDLYGDPKSTCMAFGIETGDGWFNLIHELCTKLTELGLGPNFKADQIKEKYGTLRFYYSGAPKDNGPAIDELILDAENKSERTCETCSAEGEINTKDFWISVRCEKCRSTESEQKDV